MRVFIVLFVQLQVTLFVSLFSGLAPVFVERFTFQLDFRDLFLVTSDWIHGVDPYLHSRFVTPPPSLLPILPLQVFGIVAASFFFLIINSAIVVASLRGTCDRFKMSRRENLLFLAIASMYFPVIFLLERGNLDGIMLGLILVSIFAQNRTIRAIALGLSISFKVYSILLLAPLMLARRWKQLTLTLLTLALLLLAFHSQLSKFAAAQTTRSAELLAAENLCPIGMLSPLSATAVAQPYTLSRVVVLAYLALWIASYAFMLFRHRDSGLTTKSVYSLAWMLAMPLQVFPYTGVLLLPVLALRSCEMADRGVVTIPDRLFLIGFCLTGFQQTAFSWYTQFAPAIRLFDSLNPLGTALVIGSLVLQTSKSKEAGPYPASVAG